MKYLILFIVSLITSQVGFSQEGQTVTVTVENVLNAKGNVVFALHSKDTFMKSAGLMFTAAKAEGKPATVTFENVKPGTYAILVLHDENENSRMDFNEKGMPTESYGISNNATSFGPPRYEDAKFNVSDKDIDLKIRF